MAILGAFEVQVVVDGKVAEEYENDEADIECDAEESITKYVLAESDKEFYLYVGVAPTFTWGQADTVVARLNIDGKKHSGVCLSKCYCERSHYIKRKLDGVYSGSGDKATLYKFAFAKLETRASTCLHTCDTSSTNNMKVKRVWMISRRR